MSRLVHQNKIQTKKLITKAKGTSFFVPQ